MKTWIIAIAVLVVVGLAGFTGFELANKKYKAKLERAQTNFNSLIQGIRYSVDSMRTDTRAMKMSQYELKQSFPGLKEELKQEFGIELRRTKFLMNTTTEYNRDFKVFVKDSFQNKQAEYAFYEDKWNSFLWLKPNGVDSANVNIYVKDSIAGILHRVPRSFAEWWHGQPKKFDLTIKNFNPNSRIKYQRLIQVHR
jgi:hypothetical protein